jgi:hypothetical protein
MIEGTEMAKNNAFERIYASSFYFNERGVAKWPAQVVNYTNKTQFLFRIEKGVLDINDPGVNDYFSPDEMRVPFRNMVYIGDSDTDIPCMKLVNSYGGHAIGVYNPYTKDKNKVYKMIKDNRIKYFAPADYSEDSELDRLVKIIVDRTAANEILENIYYDSKKEAMKATDNNKISEEDKLKEDLIVKLSNSSSFAFTHLIIKELSKYNNWTADQKDALYNAFINNEQISWIAEDNDVNLFYSKLLNDDEKNDNAKQVHKMLVDRGENS